MQPFYPRLPFVAACVAAAMTLAPAAAHACLASTLERGFLLDAAPAPVPGQVAAEVEIIAVQDAVEARILRVIQGPAPGDGLTLRAREMTSCDRLPLVGQRGLVAGQARLTAHGRLEIDPIRTPPGARAWRDPPPPPPLAPSEATDIEDAGYLVGFFGGQGVGTFVAVASLIVIGGGAVLLTQGVAAGRMGRGLSLYALIFLVAEIAWLAPMDIYPSPTLAQRLAIYGQYSWPGAVTWLAVGTAAVTIGAAIRWRRSRPTGER